MSTHNLLPLSGEHAIVSGGVGDIGLATARALARAGAVVAVGDLGGKDIAAKAGFHHTEVDVSVEHSVQGWLDSLEAHWGVPPSIIVANAGIVICDPALSASVEDWNRTLAVNLTGAWLTAREAALRLIRANRKGRIVLVGSWAGHAPHASMAAYSVAKAGLRMAGKCLALELAPYGITVNEIAPGYVDAGLTGRIFSKDKAISERSRMAVPTRGLLSVEEVAASILSLCDLSQPHLTGATLVLDGGLSLIQGPIIRGDPQPPAETQS